jgi:GTPase SAR1 family protein
MFIFKLNTYFNRCGQERFRSIAKSYFRRADGVVLMYDTTCEQSFINVREWIQSINEITDRSIPIIIIGNKTDLRESASRNNIKVINYQDGLKFAKVIKNLLFFIYF